MPLHPFNGVLPRLGERVFLAPGAHVAGDVELGDDVSLWFHTVARGDVNTIRIGPRTNVQDGSVLHVTHERHPLRLGAGVVVGHQAVLHGCTVEDGALIGIGARVLDGAVVESGAQVGAGAVVAPGTRVPAGHLVLGVPARVARPLRDDERRAIGEIAGRYVALKDRYLAALGEGR
ncbi:MAG TPA: gamma carbonic anhydrase family protein [Thermoanaerobaculia bacterium]|nr:gamma carbonic anhydrase family protein [Thermoanaerobaculia bacterium]